MVKNSMGLVSRLWRLMVSLWVMLVLITGGIVIWRMSTTTGETICLQFASTDRTGQIVYPSIIDTRRGIVASLPDHIVPDAVVTISENGTYRVRQYYHFKRVISVPYKTVVETIGTNTVIPLPMAVSNNSVVWSHDGSQFAYYNLDTSSGTNTFLLVLANADGSNSINLPLSQFNLIHYLNWSPDNQYLLVADYFHAWLLHASDRQVQIIVPQTKDERVDVIQWSPQGHLLAYLWTETHIIPNHIVIFDPDTANQQIYARTDEKYWWNGRLLWSDDLQYVAAVGWTDGLIDIVGTDGAGTSLSDVGLDNKSLAAMWLPTADRFIFITGNNELVAYDAVTGSYQSLATEVFDLHVESMEDQQSIIFTQKQTDGTPALVKLDILNNQRSLLITPQPTGWIIRFYTLSDHTKLIVVLWENETINIDLFDVGSGERQRLAGGLSNYAMQTKWSDPNTFMFFWNITDKSTRQLIRSGWDVYDLNGKRKYQFQGDAAAFTSIYDSGQYFVPFWSPDQRYAVFTGTDPDLFKGLVVMSSDGQQAWQIKETVRKIDFNHILWSPDSSKVVFIVNIHGESVGLVYTAEGKLLAKARMPLSSDYLHWTACDF